MKNANAIAQSRKISFKPANANDEKQIRAEFLHTNFIVLHNISFLTADLYGTTLQSNVSRLCKKL